MTAGRVVAAHQIARSAFRLAGATGALALVLWGTGATPWAPVHLFLAGTVLLAISGAAPLFTITWAAARPPGARLAAAQRWAVALGATLAVVGVEAESSTLIVVGGLAVAVGILLLGTILVGTVRHSLLRRFDMSVRFYLLALACGLVGVTLGTLLALGSFGPGFAEMRTTHVHLNLVGLIGLTIIGTLPTFLPTLARHPMISGAEYRLAWPLAVIAVILIATVPGPAAIGVGTLGVAAVGLLVAGGILLRLRQRILRGGLPLMQVVLGFVWLEGWMIYDGLRSLDGSITPASHPATVATVTAGVGQVLAGSLLYLLPVVKGSPTAHNPATIAPRPWVPLLLANLGGVTLAAGWRPAGLLLVAWVFDFILRLWRA